MKCTFRCIKEVQVLAFLLYPGVAAGASICSGLEMMRAINSGIFEGKALERNAGLDCMTVWGLNPFVRGVDS